MKRPCGVSGLHSPQWQENRERVELVLHLLELVPHIVHDLVETIFGTVVEILHFLGSRVQIAVVPDDVIFVVIHRRRPQLKLTCDDTPQLRVEVVENLLLWISTHLSELGLQRLNQLFHLILDARCDGHRRRQLARTRRSLRAALLGAARRAEHARECCHGLRRRIHG